MRSSLQQQAVGCMWMNLGGANWCPQDLYFEFSTVDMSLEVSSLSRGLADEGL